MSRPANRRYHAWSDELAHRWFAIATTAACWLLAAAGMAPATDWPTYQHDAARSGITTDPLAAGLVEAWVFRPQSPPSPAWGMPKKVPVEGILELPRNRFDDALHVAAADGRVYFGSSADGKVYCLDAASGKIDWVRRTAGPVRLAPALWEGRVYAGSDDGWVYCWDGRTGAVVWRFRAAPEDRRMLGNGRMISRWPLRSGVLVDGGVAYVTAGVFPAEGVFFHALDARNGRVLWSNDTGGEAPQSQVSPQGYLLASKTTLFAPMGRVSPAALDRSTGKLQYTPFFGKEVGGTYALVDRDEVYTGTEELLAYRADSRERLATYPGHRVVVAPDAVYLASTTRLKALDRKAYPAASNKVTSLLAQREKLNKPDAKKKTPADATQIAQVAEQLKDAERQLARATRWDVPCRQHDAMILAGNTLVVGGEGRVATFAAADGKALWSAELEGCAKGLASADGRLWVSSDSGAIHCFAPQGSPRGGVVTQAVRPDPFSGVAKGPDFRAAAKAILDDAKIRRGYCLVAGVETGQLVLELVRQSDLVVYAVSPDAAKVAAAQEALDAAGVYGTRAYVEQCEPGAIPYSDYFANLIVSETAIAGGKSPYDSEVLARMLKPLGGVAVLAVDGPKAGAEPQSAASAANPSVSAPVAPTVAKTVRGPIAGAGNWTHQYGNAANTGSGDDEALRCPWELLWFGQPGAGNMVNRHIRAAAPLAMDGRLLVQGENVVMALDAYNGVLLWERMLPGAFRTVVSRDASNLAVNHRSLFLAMDGRCLAIDPASGQTQKTFSLPAAADGKPRRWAYVACDDATLLGSRSAAVPRLSEAPWNAVTHSDCVFALDAATGGLRWTYEGRSIPHSAIALAGGKVILVDGNVAADERQAAIDEAETSFVKPPAKPAAAKAKKAAKANAKPAKKTAAPDVRAVVALDAATGRRLWRRAMVMPQGDQESIALLAAKDAVLVFGVYSDGHYWAEFLAGRFADRRITAISADDGAMRWSRPLGYRVRPLVIGDTLHAEPWTFDLATGEPKNRVHPITGQSDRWQFCRPGHHCGLPIGSPHCLIFRSWCLGYYDLEKDDGTMHFGGQRPGCWINAVPAGGLLLMPEASTGCMCAFPNMCSIALKPTETNNAYTWYSAPGPMTPVRRVGILFGAPGDRKDAAGQLWIGFPRPRPDKPLVLPLGARIAFLPGGEFLAGNSRYPRVTGIDEAWRFAFAAVGVQRIDVPLLGNGDAPACYRVRLHLADPHNAEPGRRVFLVKLQGKTVAESLDIAKESGGRNRALVKQFAGVAVSNGLTLEFVPKVARPAADQTPILQALEVIRE
jgi:outer membrane protein assembly factor BamB